ncbi:uncharacterized protein PAC_02484 [Phialocephala subalpina]|uniref:Ankyrin n=1 Tax=Phialocephala subalpina TaxID=576137 RepID=A0A1L7WIL6_9HELO|nr:uncharacterized protein PAC_02484 [Phialocephala subalpina]
MNKGGRPRNDWTPSRKRKLARLYTLTSLDKDEIVAVLRAHKFDPSSSDVQKKLRDLLPRDYAKEYRSFRPLKDHSISIRLDKLRKRSYHQSSARPNAVQTKSQDVQSFEGPVSAFRDYSGTNPIRIPQTLVGTPQEEPESQIVVPSLLLLDGSFVLPTIEEVVDLTDTEQTPNNKSTPPNSQTSSVLSLGQLAARIKRSSSFLRQVHAALRLSSTNSWRSSLSKRSSEESVQSLMHMKGIVHSTIQNHRTSETESLAPRPGSPDSRQSGQGHLSAPSANAVLEAIRPNERSLKSPEHEHSLTLVRPMTPKGPSLSETEERVWHDLIQDGSLNSPFSARPEFAGMCLQWRICCEHWVKRCRHICRGCGMRQSHRLGKANTGHVTSTASQEMIIPPETLYRQDYFGNTPLHFAAASPNWQTEYLIDSINDGTTISSVNTSGATFLHVLFENLGSSSQFRDAALIIRHLATRAANQGFPFGLRDCHGRTAIHMLFDNRHRLLDKPLSQQDQDALLEIVELMSLRNKTLMDNLGRCVGDLFQHDAAGNPLLPQKPTTPGNSFIGAMSELASDPAKWLLSAAPTDKYSWVDSNGDTALIALVKGWDAEKDETQLPDIIRKLVESGSAVDMRDRAGNTALAIATRRGLRPAATTLLKLGACIHTRNYLGVGILRGARRELRQTRREDDDKPYAMILSCITLMIDKGAVMHPSGYQEWAVPSSPLAQNPDLHAEILALQNRHHRDNAELDLMYESSYL